MNISNLNSFYGLQACRHVVLNLYKSKCQKCGKTITGNWDISHIYPRSKPDDFIKLVGGEINVDNLINLVPMHEGCNRSNGDATIDNPLLLFNTLSYTQKIVSSRLPKVMPTPIDLPLNKGLMEIKEYLYMIKEFNYSFGRWVALMEDERLDIDFCESLDLDYDTHPIANIERITGKMIKTRTLDDLIIQCPKTVSLNDITTTKDVFCFIRKDELSKLYASI